MMAGTVAGEYDTSVYGLPDEAVVERIYRRFGDRVTPRLLETYIANDPERSYRDALMDLLNDLAIRMPALNTLEAQAAAGGTAYLYYFDYTPEGDALRAQHLFEIPFFNDKLDIPVHDVQKLMNE